MQKLFLFFPVFLILLSAQVCADVVINEVHAAGNEWVELYNSGNSSADLDGWEIADNKSDDTLENLVLNGSSFGLIIDKDLNCSNFSVPEESCWEEAAIGSGLNDDRENLTLYNYSGSVVDNLIWTSDQEETFSIGRIPDGGSWNYSLEPTPGQSNSQEENISDGTDSSNDGAQDTMEDGSSESSTEVNRNVIRITDYPGSVKFGGVVSVEIKVSKNETNKYAIYARIERPSDGWDVSEESKVYLKDKNQNYTLMIPVLVKSNCNWRYDNGTYRLLVKGLGTQDTEEIRISGTGSGICEEIVKVEEKTKEVVKEVCSCNTTPAKEYEIFSWDSEVESGEEVETVVLIRNRDNETRELEVYSYIYEENTPVNEGGWKGNTKVVRVDPLENEVLLMVNRIKEDVEPGTYQLKVRIKDEVDLVRKVEVIETNETLEGGNISKRTNKTSEQEIPSENVSKENLSTRDQITGKVFRKKGPLEEFLDFFSGIFDFL